MPRLGSRENVQGVHGKYGKLLVPWLDTRACVRRGTLWEVLRTGTSHTGGLFLVHPQSAFGTPTTVECRKVGELS